MASIHPHINFNGNAEEAFTFYKSVFGGEFAKVMRFKDMAGPEFPVSEQEANKIMHIALPIGYNVLMGNDVPEILGRTNENENRSKIVISAESKEEADHLFSGLSAGGQIEMPISDSPWGSYFGMFRDKYGIEWMVDFDSKYKGENIERLAYSIPENILTMKRVIAAFNMTLDGICDHTAGIADEELHQHYTDLVNNAGTILYGRTTYELMQFWQTHLQNPSSKESMDEFAVSINKIQKIVFSTTLQNTGWETAALAKRPLLEEVLAVKQGTGADILIGSRSLIIQLLNNNLIDELQICIHPLLEGKGMLLFDEIQNNILLKLIKIKSLQSGATILYYEPVR